MEAKTIKELPIGVDDFGELVRGNYDFCDKTTFIRDIITVGAKVTLITRPRGWGKTLNVSMLHYFFSSEVDGVSTKGLFDNLDIAKFDGGKYIEQYQGKYPTIFLSFKDVEGENFEASLENFYEMVLEVYRQYIYLLESKKLSSFHKNELETILSKRAKRSELKSSLYLLCECLYKHHDNQRVYVLIDEYDTSLNCAYMTRDEEYLKSMSKFIHDMFAELLKGNNYLEKGVLTGILRVPKANIFSGLNNLEVCTILDKLYSNCFGFNKIEVKELFEKQGFDYDNEVDKWYSGYKIANETLFNPFSIISFLCANCQFCSYWVKTVGDDLVKDLIINYVNKGNKLEFLELLQRKDASDAYIDKHITHCEIDTSQVALWSVLLSFGYLTCEKSGLSCTVYYECKIRIPNVEVRSIFDDIFREWFEKIFPDKFSCDKFLNYFKFGNVNGFMEDLEKFVLGCEIFRDSKTKKDFIRGLVLGLRASKRDFYFNLERDHKKFHLMLTPKKKGLKAWIFEFKVVKEKVEMKSTAESALRQIRELNYKMRLKNTGCVDYVINCGICFYKKSALAAYCTYNFATKQYSEVIYTEPLQPSETRF